MPCLLLYIYVNRYRYYWYQNEARKHRVVYWQDRFKERTGIKLIWKFSGAVGIYMINSLLYSEAESEGMVSTHIMKQKASWRGTARHGQEGGR